MKQAFPITPFLEKLASRGFMISIRDYRRIHRVFATQASWTWERLQNVLTSLLVSSEEQQTIFTETYTSYFKHYDDPTELLDVKQWHAELNTLLQDYEKTIPLSALPKAESGDQTISTKPTTKKTLVNSKIWHKKAIIITAILITFAIGLLLLCQLTNFCSTEIAPPPVSPEPPVLPEPPQPPEQEIEKETVRIQTKTVTEEPSWLASYQPYWKIIFGISSSLALLLFYLWWLGKRTPKVKLHPVDPTLPDKHFDETHIGGALPPLLTETELDQLTDLLAYVESEESSSHINMPASIKATLKAGGMVDLKYKKKKRLQSILILEDNNNKHTSWNTLAKEWAQALQQRGIPCLYGHYQHTPEQFLDEQGRLCYLEDFEDQKHQLQLFLFTDSKQAQALVDFPLQDWDFLHLFTYHETRYWDEREARLQQVGAALRVAEKQALLNALQGVAPEKVAIQQNARLVQDIQENDYAYLQRHLGQALPWAEACCLYPGAFTLGAAEKLRQQFLPEIPFRLIQRVLQLPGSWTDKQRIECSPRLLLVLRQRFQQRSPAWKQQVVTAWQQLLAEHEPANPQSLSWQIWQWKIVRIGMESESNNEQAVEKLYKLMQSCPALKASIQAELDQVSQSSSIQNAPPLPIPQSKKGKKYLHALAKQYLKPQDIAPHRQWQRALASLFAGIALSSLVWGNWTYALPENDAELVFAMVKIPQGEFKMGCVSGQNCTDDEKPVRDVSVAAFMLSATEVTNQQYVGFLNAIEKVEADWFYTKSQRDDSHIIKAGSQYQVEQGFADRPVIRMSWDGAKAYLQWLSDKTGQEYRLPSEAEWEYAARAGTTTQYWWGNEISRDNANYGKDVCCGGLAKGKDQWEETAPVAQFEANPWGLYDTSGNVWEWVEDCWHDNYDNAPTDSSVWNEACGSDSRVLRGGSWDSRPEYLRSANRNYGGPDVRSYSVGFRAARTLKSDAVDNLLLPDMVDIPAGVFQMGCVSGKGCQSDEKPVHTVKVKAFMLSKHEITNEQYVAFLNDRKQRGSKEEPWFETKAEESTSRITDNDGIYSIEAGYEQHPVVNVSWFGAKAYLQWLQDKTGHAYRLPSEAEWEYAVRAGTTTPYSTGECINTEQANYYGNADWLDCPNTDVFRGNTTKVGDFPANNWNLHDMHGNAWEWVEDCWHSDYSNAPEDGRVWKEDCTSDARVLRGGSWLSFPAYLRSAYRDSDDPDGRDGYVGFRAARTKK